MQRITQTPRENWRELIASQGLVFSESTADDGATIDYWNESAAYQFSLTEVLALEAVTENLHTMALEAARFLAAENRRPGGPWSLGIPPYAVEYAQASFDRGDPTLYGRFDLVYGTPGEPPKMLEYNADTPTGLVEASVVQWFWLQDVHGHAGTDQWNGLHEALVARWQRVMQGDADATVHFAHTGLDTSGEDLMTVSYLRDCADQAGLTTRGIEMTEIGFDTSTSRFVDLQDQPIEHIFKLYPWEDMMAEGFGPQIAHTMPAGWLEPAWKMFLSNKALAAAMWHLYPGHPNLLPTHVGSPTGLTEYVKKPLHGREGAGIEIRADGVTTTAEPSRYGAEGHVYQQWCPLPDFPGDDGSPNHPVLGSWVVGDESFGVGIRESDGFITDVGARFVPNIIR